MAAVTIEIGTDSDVGAANANSALTVDGINAGPATDFCSCCTTDVDVLSSVEVRVHTLKPNAHVLPTSDASDSSVLRLLVLIPIQRDASSCDARPTDNREIMRAPKAAVSALKRDFAVEAVCCARNKSRTFIVAPDVSATVDTAAVRVAVHGSVSTLNSGRTILIAIAAGVAIASGIAIPKLPGVISDSSRRVRPIGCSVATLNIPWPILQMARMTAFASVLTAHVIS